MSRISEWVTPQHVQELLRFGLAGLLNAMAAYSSFALLLFLGVHYTIATLLGGIAGLLVGFQTSSLFVFRRRGHFLAFLATFLGTYVLNVLVQRWLHAYVTPYGAGAIAMLLTLTLSYLLNRRFAFGPRSSAPGTYGESYAAIQIRRSRNPVRRWVRNWYLRDILRHIEGPSVDVGCGAGDMLALLPEGSLGLEVNPAAVEYCRSRGLNAQGYNPTTDAYRFEELVPGRYHAMLFTHVLEHLEDPASALGEVFQSCMRLGIRRVILTLPCERGFRFDPTHRTYVDLNYLSTHGLLGQGAARAAVIRHFPINWAWLGRIYTFHELRVVFDLPAVESPALGTHEGALPKLG